MWDEEDNNPYGSFNPDASADHNNAALTSSCEMHGIERHVSLSNALQIPSKQALLHHLSPLLNAILLSFHSPMI